MKRLTVMLMAMLCALALSPSTAQAADPVAVLRAQLVKNRGVTIVERSIDTKRKAISLRTKIVVQLGRSGAVASDVTTTTIGDKHPLRLRAIFVHGRAYFQDGRELPEGKRWVLRSDKSEPAVGIAQPVNVLEPTTLRALLRSATSVRRDGAETLHSGAISYGELAKISPSYRASAMSWLDSKKTVVEWRLWIDAKGLVLRLVTSSKTGFGGGSATDTRFTDWRSGVSLDAPPEDEVIKAGELDQ